MNRPDIVRAAGALAMAGAGAALGVGGGAVRIGGLALVVGGACHFVARRLAPRAQPPSAVVTLTLSLLDRLGESLVFGGAVVYFQRIGNVRGAALAVGGMAAWLMAAQIGLRARGPAAVVIGAAIVAHGAGPSGSFLFWITAAVAAAAPVAIAMRLIQVSHTTPSAPHSDSGATRKRDTRAPLRR